MSEVQGRKPKKEICVWCKKVIKIDVGGAHAYYGRKGKVHRECRTPSANAWFEERRQERLKRKEEQSRSSFQPPPSG